MKDLDYSTLSDYELAAFKYHRATKIQKMTDEEYMVFQQELDKRSLPKENENFEKLQALEDLKGNPMNKPKCPNCKTLKSKQIKPNEILEMYSILWAYHFGRYSIRKYYQCIICTLKYSIRQR